MNLSRRNIVLIGVLCAGFAVLVPVLLAESKPSQADAHLSDSAQSSSDAVVSGGDPSALILSEAIHDEMNEAELSVDQQHKLVERVSAIAEARDHGTAEEYVDLMRSWGGAFPYLPGDTSDQEQLAYGEHHLSNWQGKADDYGVSQRYVERAGLRVASRGEPNEANMRPSGNLIASSARITSFVFDDDVRALAARGTLAIEVKMPVVLNNGLEREVGYLMLWSEQEQQWLPYMHFERQKKESPSDAVGFYLSFF